MSPEQSYPDRQNGPLLRRLLEKKTILSISLVILVLTVLLSIYRINIPLIFKRITKETNLDPYDEPHVTPLPGFIDLFSKNNGISNRINYNQSTSLSETCSNPPAPLPLIKPSNDMPISLQNYIHLHEQGTLCISNPSSCKKRPKLLIWTCQIGHCGGLGDRLRFIRFAFLFALISNRVFYIHWPQLPQASFNILSALIPSYIDWRLPNEDLLDENNDSTFIRFNYNEIEDYKFANPFPNKNQTGILELDLKSSNFTKVFEGYEIIQLSPRFYCSEIKGIYLNPNNDHIFKYFPSSLTMLQLEKYLSLFLFRPSAGLNQLIQSRSFPYGVDYIGVHLRTGFDDGGDDPNRFELLKSKGIKDLSYETLQCVLRLDTQTNWKNVFIASDSKSLKQNLSEIGNSLKLNMKTNSDKITFHLDRYPSGTYQGQAETCMAFLEVFADLFGLAGAKKIIYLFSGFPRIALSLGNIGMWHELSYSEGLSDTECFPRYMSSWTRCENISSTDLLNPACVLKDKF